MGTIPKRYRLFTQDYPAAAAAYEALGAAVHGAGPLDDRTRALIKLAVSVGARLEGAVHAHARKALAAGLAPAELRHAVLLALPTIGLPPTMAAMSWLDDVLTKAPKKRKKK